MGNLAQAVSRSAAITRRIRGTLYSIKQALSGEGNPELAVTLLRELRILAKERARWRGQIAATLAQHPEVVEALVERQFARLEARLLEEFMPAWRLRPESPPSSSALELQAAFGALLGFPGWPSRRRRKARTIRQGMPAELAQALTERRAASARRVQAAIIRLNHFSQATEVPERGQP